MKKRINLWIVSTILAVYLLPVGLICAVCLTWYEATRKTDKNKAILYCGIGTMIFSATMSTFMAVVPTGTDMTFPTVFFALPMIYGIYALCVYTILARRANRIAQLHLLVQQEHITSLRQLCQITDLPHKRTVRLLELMIRRSVLDGAWIDEATETIRFHKSIWARQRFTCSDCGAVLTVDLGHTLTCAYCGSALSHDRISPTR